MFPCLRQNPTKSLKQYYYGIRSLKTPAMDLGINTVGKGFIYMIPINVTRCKDETFLF